MFSRGYNLLDDMFNSLYDDYWPPSHWGYGPYLALYPSQSSQKDPQAAAANLKGREWYKTLDLQGYIPDNVKIEVKGGRVIVNATRQEGNENEGFDRIEARRFVDIPGDVDQESIRTAMDKRGRVCVIGLRKTPEGGAKNQMVQRQDSNFWPSILQFPTWEDSASVVEDESGLKKFQMTYDLSGFKPEEIKVKQVGDHISVNAEHKEETDDRFVHRQFHRTCHLPKGTQAEQMRSIMDNMGNLVVSAPITEPPQEEEKERNLPVEMQHGVVMGDGNAEHPKFTAA